MRINLVTRGMVSDRPRLSIISWVFTVPAPTPSLLALVTTNRCSAPCNPGSRPWVVWSSAAFLIASAKGGQRKYWFSM
ncbi:hypothetical protein D3C78_1828150 [compost metagenome]